MCWWGGQPPPAGTPGYSNPGLPHDSRYETIPLSYRLPDLWSRSCRHQKLHRQSARRAALPTYLLVWLRAFSIAAYGVRRSAHVLLTWESAGSNFTQNDPLSGPHSTALWTLQPLRWCSSVWELIQSQAKSYQLQNCVQRHCYVVLWFIFGNFYYIKTIYNCDRYVTMSRPVRYSRPAEVEQSRGSIAGISSSQWYM